jgi:putative ABC transport system permease protein
MVPITYNIRSLAVRRSTTLAAAFGVALVVFVLCGVMMLTKGVRQTIMNTARSDNALILRKGADAELSSSIHVSKVAPVVASPGIARNPSGQPIASAEAVVLLMTPKIGAQGMANVTIRGVDEHAYEFRPEVKIVEGRKPRAGSNECVIGRAIRGRYKAVDLGQRIEMRTNRFLEVVGIMASGDSAIESEIWADTNVVRSAFGRQNTVQSVRARLTSPEAFDGFKRYVEDELHLGLQVERETDYYERQSEGSSGLIAGLGGVISFFFALGAIIGAMITMYSMVANRTREIGTLRALGFGRLSIVSAFVLESALLALAGGLVGALASSLLTVAQFSVVNSQTWNEVVFRFQPSAGIAVRALIFAGAMGVIGGLLPAIQAARLPVIDSLRD